MSATTAAPQDAGSVAGLPDQDGRPPRFRVHLDVFDGPFDLLLQLISAHRLDVTEVALSRVTDDFIAFLRQHTGQHSGRRDLDLDQVSEFLVIAATLLDLKAARLLPSGEVEDEEDLALLEARDLLFARLLQYRAYKQVAAQFADRLAAQALRHPRAVGLEPRFAELVPEVLLGLGPEQFAALAARVFAPRPVPTVAVGHVHAPRVSVREEAQALVVRLRRQRTTTFRALVADVDDTLVVVARFLALLELYREALVAFEQVTPLGDLTVRWTGPDDEAQPIDVAAAAEFDEELPVEEER